MKNHSVNTNNANLMNRAVLVLNANYAPMAICTAKRAIIMGYLKKVEILANYSEKVHSPSTTLNLPSVVKIHEYIRYDNLTVELNRKNILSRDGNKCQYCGVSKLPLTIDHILPKVKGGQDSWENLTTACKPCNQRKGDRTPEESDMKLLRAPKRPNRLHYFHRFVKENQNDWRPYLFMEPIK